MIRATRQGATAVAIYARYSTDRQDARSIDDQVCRCRAFADAHSRPRRRRRVQGRGRERRPPRARRPDPVTWRSSSAEAQAIPGSGFSPSRRSAASRTLFAPAVGPSRIATSSASERTRSALLQALVSAPRFADFREGRSQARGRRPRNAMRRESALQEHLHARQGQRQSVVYDTKVKLVAM